jgi:ATP-dependent DNA helicase RecG
MPPETPSRQEVPALPEKAVREAIVNALVHRNYRSPRPTQVIRYTDRIEVQNAGHSLVEDENFDVARNGPGYALPCYATWRDRLLNVLRNP